MLLQFNTILQQLEFHLPARNHAQHCLEPHNPLHLTRRVRLLRLSSSFFPFASRRVFPDSYNLPLLLYPYEGPFWDGLGPSLYLIGLPTLWPTDMGQLG